MLESGVSEPMQNWRGFSNCIWTIDVTSCVCVCVWVPAARPTNATMASAAVSSGYGSSQESVVEVVAPAGKDPSQGRSEATVVQLVF